MKIVNIEQRSKEWFELKVGKISGTRFGQVISGRKNGLVFEMLNEILDGYIEPTEFISDDMQYGIDNEDKALELYSIKTGVKVKKVGAIVSDLFDIHMASPDGISECETIIQEVKCTMSGKTQLERYFNGVDTKYLPQCINYFAIDSKIKEVHFISYCGYRSECELVIKILKREDYQKEIELGIKTIPLIAIDLENKKKQILF